MNYQAVRDCVAGHIYDSSPVDFTSDLGTRFIVHPSVLKLSNPPRFVSWLANGIASGLDGLFLSRFESQRAEYWQTLYSSVTIGAPYLIMCSEDDDLAPFETICNFARRLEELGGDVKLVKWTSSTHVGHYRQHPVEYKGAVTELLGKASANHSGRIQRLEGGGMMMSMGFDSVRDEISNLRKAAASSNDIFKRFSSELAEHAVVPKSTFEYDGGRAVRSVQDEKPDLVHLPSPPRINANGVLGQILFDVCVPKNIEEWDVGSLSSLRHSPFPSTRRHPLHFNPIKCIRRSRL
ncbi:putative isoprenylcysteine alpha-carbonyl methylesterase ICMEL1 [Bienertia sinuspersici]